jgi:beta-glucosidase
MVTDTGDIIVPQGKYTLSVGGGQPDGGLPSTSGNFEVSGRVMLPE